MAETLSMVSVISFAAAAVFFVLAAVLWFYFKIPSVMGDLSGRNARKSMEQLRKDGRKESFRRHQVSSAYPAKEGKGMDQAQMGSDAIGTEELSIQEKTDVLVQPSLQSGSGMKLTILEEIVLVHTKERFERDTNSNILMGG